MKTKLALLASAVATFITLLFFDIWKILPSPLPVGVNHWIPELIFMFFVGRFVTQGIYRKIGIVIVTCLPIYTILTYLLMYGEVGARFGLGTGSLFVASFLLGVWSRTRYSGK